MAIDVSTEEVIRLVDARNHLPSSRCGKKLAKAVLFRWANQGCRGVVLETVRIGGGRFTSREALMRFVAAMNHSQPTAQRPSQTGKQAVTAAALARLGI